MSALQAIDPGSNLAKLVKNFLGKKSAESAKNPLEGDKNRASC